MSTLPDCLKTSKCIIHVDLDCFYSQVEEVRLGLDSSKPVAVQQWTNLLAVNYPARAYGVSRMISAEEAKRLCPDITLVHVPTYAPNETEAKYHDNPSISTHKTSLDVYHTAGKKLFHIFKQHSGLLQKLGADEAFMDVTDQVNERLVQDYLPAHPALLDAHGLPVSQVGTFFLDWTSLNHVIPSSKEKERRDTDASYYDPVSWFDIQLFVASQLTGEIRKHVFDELGYTCSAGIAHNKVLAKLGSSRNKPNKQTIIRQHIASEFMKDIPFTKIRNLGGKFGQSVGTKYNIKTAGDLWQYALKDLQKDFNESSGLWLYNIIRGIDHEEVILNKAPTSLVASKHFRLPLCNEKDLVPWYPILSAELHTRVMRNWEEHHTWPKTLLIFYQSVSCQCSRSRSTAMALKAQSATSKKIQQKVTTMFTDIIPDLLPCSTLTIMATQLAPLTNHTISEFFTPLATNSMTTTRDHTVKPLMASSRLITQSISNYHDPLVELPPGTTWTCDKCHEPIPLEQVDEHTDYHFALDLHHQSSTPKRLMQQETGAKKRSKHHFFRSYDNSLP